MILIDHEYWTTCLYVLLFKKGLHHWHKMCLQNIIPLFPLPHPGGVHPRSTQCQIWTLELTVQVKVYSQIYSFDLGTQNTEQNYHRYSHGHQLAAISLWQCLAASVLLHNPHAVSSRLHFSPPKVWNTLWLDVQARLLACSSHLYWNVLK